MHRITGLLVVGLLTVAYVALLARGAEIISQSMLDETYEAFLDTGVCYGAFGVKVKCHD